MSPTYMEINPALLTQRFFEVLGSHELRSTGNVKIRFVDDDFSIEDENDTTKRAYFEVSGLTTERLYSLPNASGTLAVAGFTTVTDALTFIINGNGSAISTGIAGDLYVPFACTVTARTALADQVGSIQVDIWKDTYANYPPTDPDSITASAPVVISTDDASHDTTLTGWTTSIAAGSTLRFNVDSCSGITRCTIALTVTRTL